MSTALIDSYASPWLRRLSLPAYRVRDAARYAGVRSGTLGYWHRASGHRQATLPRREPGRPLSYYELIEVAFVATFRSLGLSLQKIRAARDYAVRELGSEYPFVQYTWKTEGAHVMVQVPELEGDSAVRQIVAADMDGQVAWESVVADRFDQFDYQEGLALIWHLVRRGIPVSIDPRVSFGAPAVRGIPTSILKGRWNAGESVQHLQADYSLSRDDVLHGLRFEGVTDSELSAIC